MITEILILTLIIEASTIIGRFIFGPVKDRYNKNNFKYKVRIHHGYIGFVLILFFVLYTNNLLAISGFSLFISDVIHHFLVLPIWIKKTEFP